jgi:hypothetical protein
MQRLAQEGPPSVVIWSLIDDGSFSINVSPGGRRTRRRTTPEPWPLDRAAETASPP